MQVMHRQKMTRRGLLAALCGLLAAAVCSPSCSEWDTDTLGQRFVPANSQVRQFTHLVYVDFTSLPASVWGPGSAEVTANIDGRHVEVCNEGDSLALFAYGYPSEPDTSAVAVGSLTVLSSRPYALYLGGLTLHSSDGPAISSRGGGACHVVLPRGSRNQLFGPMEVDGPLHVTGRGALDIHSRPTCLTAASLQCQYDVSVTLCSAEGHGISLQGPMRSTLGTWSIDAAGQGVTSADSIVLYAGTYQGTAAGGPFLTAHSGVYLRRPQLIAACGERTHYLDSALVAQRYDSVQSVWQESLPALTLTADSLYGLFRQGETTPLARLRPRHPLPQPWVIFSGSALRYSDTLRFEQIPTVKGK